MSKKKQQKKTVRGKLRQAEKLGGDLSEDV